MKPSIEFYLDYVNNFLSVSGLASHYDITKDEAQSLIARSKVLYWAGSPNNRRAFYNNVNSQIEYRRQQANKWLLSEHSA